MGFPAATILHISGITFCQSIFAFLPLIGELFLTHRLRVIGFPASECGAGLPHGIAVFRRGEAFIDLALSCPCPSAFRALSVIFKAATGCRKGDGQPFTVFLEVLFFMVERLWTSSQQTRPCRADVSLLVSQADVGALP